ncbi:hypothetical protein AMC99_02298 [Altererythrobacter epoxidivorans]|uniref:Uncharacterized protein n=1 Tax=Altererythrobacter epoxidivorans TaxID=361183 RepID=A0A0M4M9M5_9SPHN|nr:hypothetical protein [Altererythrobacter epoxidivorans]ALE17573.1 hypothetical protein AMC99_02298 [Altererythrobacter epoxidivorans]
MTRIAKITALALGGALALSAMPAAAEEPVEKPEPTKGEQQLAKLLEGRVAGEPERCIPARFNEAMQVIDETALVYGRGKTIWVNIPRYPQGLDDRDTLVIKRWGTQICRLDSVTMMDPSSKMTTGAIFLGDFVPYTRVEADKSDG